jgi:hypothetical protein
MSAEMEEPPFLIDGALVMHYATVDVERSRPNRSLGFAGGIPLDAVRGVIVARNLVDDSIFAMYCNDRWETIAATPHADGESAMRGADAAFSEAKLRWTPFRELTAAERSEIETTREFLKDLETDFPDDPPVH